MKCKVCIVITMAVTAFLISCSDNNSSLWLKNNLSAVQTWFDAWKLISSDKLYIDSRHTR